MTPFFSSPTDDYPGNQFADSLGAVFNRSSFSGVDYKVHIVLPPSSTPLKWQIGELQDELTELEYRRSQLVPRMPDPHGVAGIIQPPLAFFPELSSKAKAEIEAIDKAMMAINLQIQKVNKAQGKTLLILDSLQTISCQVHRGKKPVRSLGAVYPKGYTSGGRFIAGSMIFTVFEEHPLIKLIDSINSIFPSAGEGGRTPRLGAGMSNKDQFLSTTAMADELPPLNIFIMAINEHGSSAVMSLYGVQFLNEGLVASVQDMITEATISFVATDMDPMRTLDTRGIMNIKVLDRKVTVSDLLTTQAALSRKLRRNYPF